MKHRPYVIGLTGNIAVGKSTVARMLADLGACLLDADILAHGLMAPGSEAQGRIVQRFGPAVLTPQGTINRGALGAIVFRDPEALRDLEQILHPAVVEETLRWLSGCTAEVAVVEAIKLLEADMHRHCDAVWVVTTTRAQQVERLMTTRHLTAAEAELRIDAQPPQELKLARADVIIDNSGDLQATWQQVVAAREAIPGVPHVADKARWPKEGGEP